MPVSIDWLYIWVKSADGGSAASFIRFLGISIDDLFASRVLNKVKPELQWQRT